MPAVVDTQSDFRHTEIGIVPNDWKVVHLKTCVEPNRAIRYGVVQPGAHCHDGPLMLRSQDYSKGWSDASEMHRVHPYLAEQYRNAAIQGGDLIVTVVGANLGQIAQLPEWFGQGVLSRSTARVAIDSARAERGYVKYYLQSPVVRRQMLDDLKEGAQPVLSCLDLGEFLIALPSDREEQRAIATALSDVDGLLGSLDALIAKKKAIKQGAMQQLLTGKQRLPGFKGEWEVKRLGEVAEFTRVNVIPLHRPEVQFAHFSLPAFDDGQIPVLELGSAIATNKFGVPNDAVLLSKLNPRIPRVWMPKNIPEDSVASTEFLVLRPKALITRAFLFMACSSPEFAARMELGATGTTGSHQRVTPRDAVKLELKMPIAIQEQTAIATVLSDMDAEIGALEARRAKTALLKQGMMQELLTGRTRLV